MQKFQTYSTLKQFFEFPSHILLSLADLILHNETILQHFGLLYLLSQYTFFIVINYHRKYGINILMYWKDFIQLESILRHCIVLLKHNVRFLNCYNCLCNHTMSQCIFHWAFNFELLCQNKEARLVDKAIMPISMKMWMNVKPHKQL